MNSLDFTETKREMKNAEISERVVRNICSTMSGAGNGVAGGLFDFDLLR